MPFGRPTKYDSSVLKITYTYLEDCESTKQIPYREALCLKLDVDEDTVTAWSKRHKDFLGAIKKLDTMQKLGLYGKSFDRSSATGAIFQLKVNHNKVETIKQEIIGVSFDD